MQVRTLLLLLPLLRSTIGQAGSPFPSNIPTQNETFKQQLTSLENNDNAAYQLAFEVHVGRPIRSDAFYQTIALAFEECLIAGTEHRGVWEFPTPYGLLLTIRPLVVPWYALWELAYYLEAIAMAQADKRAMTQGQHLSEGQGVFYKDGLAWVSIQLVSIMGVAKANIAKRQDLQLTEETNTTTLQQDGMNIVTRLFNILENATEDKLMISVIRSLRACLTDPVDILPFFHFQEPTRFIQFTLNPGNQYVSVTKSLVVQVLRVVLQREYGVKEWWRGGRFREVNVWVTRGDSQVATGELTYWPK